MPKSKSISFTSIFFLQLCLGIFFLMLGLLGLENHDSRMSEFARFLGRDDTMVVITSVVELLMGAILILGLFVRVSGSLAQVCSIGLFVLWALYMLMSFVLNDNLGRPSTLVWFYNVSWNAIILVALWVVGKKYMS